VEDVRSISLPSGSIFLPVSVQPFTLSPDLFKQTLTPLMNAFSPNAWSPKSAMNSKESIGPRYTLGVSNSLINQSPQHARKRSSACLLALTLFSTSASAKDSNSGNPQTSNQSSASLERTVNVDVTGPATVLFSVPYALTQDGSDFAHHTAASVSGSASFTPTGAFSSIDDTSRTFRLDSQSGSTLPSQTGSLIFGLVVDRPGSVSAVFDASSLATAPDPVPEPSVALLGIAGGLLVTCVSAVRRRLQKAVSTGRTS